MCVFVQRYQWRLGLKIQAKWPWLQQMNGTQSNVLVRIAVHTHIYTHMHVRAQLCKKVHVFSGCVDLQELWRNIHNAQFNIKPVTQTLTALKKTIVFTKNIN